MLWEIGVTLKTFVNYELVTKDFVFLKAAKGFAELNWGYVGAIAVAYVPVAFVVFAEHIADHKNISSIIGKDLLKDPGLSRTLLGDGVGSMAGASPAAARTRPTANPLPVLPSRATPPL